MTWWPTPPLAAQAHAAIPTATATHAGRLQSGKDVEAMSAQHCTWCGTELDDSYHPDDSTRCHELDGRKHDVERCRRVMKEQLAECNRDFHNHANETSLLIDTLKAELSKERLDHISTLGQMEDMVPSAAIASTWGASRRLALKEAAGACMAYAHECAMRIRALDSERK